MKLRALIFLSLILSCSGNNRKATDEPATTLEPAETHMEPSTKASPGTDATFTVFKNASGGYGYDIFAGEKLYIHQPHIPALAGNIPFSSEADAGKAAALVVYKMRNNMMPPGISMHELDSLGIVAGR